MFTLALWILIAVLGLALYVYPALTVRHMYEGFAAEKLTPETIQKTLALIDYFTNKTKGADMDAQSVPSGQQKVIQTQIDALPALKKQLQNFLAHPETPRDASDINSAAFSAQGGLPMALRNALKAMTPPSQLKTVLDGYNDILYSKETTGMTNTPSADAKQGTTGQDSPDMASLLQKVEALMASHTATPDLDSVVAETPSAKPKAKGLKAQPESVKEIRSEPGDVEEEETPSGALEHGKSFQHKKPRGAPEKEKEEEDEEDVPRKRRHRSHIPQDCPPAVQCPNMRDYIRKDSIPCWACKLK